MVAVKHVGLLVTFLCYLSVRYNGVEGRLNLSEQENLELEKKLKLLNKPAIKTIKTRYGEVYDCVDFYKQPSFDHPLLKNHSYHFGMEPQFPAKNVDDITSGNEPLDEVMLPEGGCPVGTVPIRRVTKDDLLRKKFASKLYDFGGTIEVVVRTDARLTGAFGFISLYNPPVQDNQYYSAARIKLQNGNDFIQFGWRVDPDLYGNNFTHLFVQTSTNSAKCFDARCGFVITRQDLAPGLYFPSSAISSPGHIKETKVRVQRDKDGNWWLAVGNKNLPAGFWPANIFTPLVATYADWGGEVSSPHYVDTPPMGSGIYPYGNTKNDAYIRFITGIDTNGQDVNVETEFFNSDPFILPRYAGLDEPVTDPEFGHLVFFGGTGKH